MRPMFESDGKYLLPADDEAVKFIQKMKGRESFEMSKTGHSIDQHRGFFKYINWVWADYGVGQWPDPDAFRAQLSIEVGHVKIIRLRICGEWIDSHHAKSWQMKKADAYIFNGLVERGSAWCQTLGAPSFEEWLSKRHEYRGA